MTAISDFLNKISGAKPQVRKHNHDDIHSSVIKEDSNADSELFLFKQVLDRLPIAVMLCDTSNDNIIFYINEGGKEVFSSQAQNLRSRFDFFNPDFLVGTSIHRFHRNPDQIRDILSCSENLPHSAEIHIDGTVFMTTVTPIISNNGKLLCFMASWSNVTAQILIGKKEKAERLQREFLQEKICSIEKDLNVLSDKIISQIDITYKIMHQARQISGNAENSIPAIKKTTDNVGAIVQSVENSAEYIDTLSHLSDSMDEIAALIEELSDQSQLVALNASIESARAGSAGRGFSVVAREMSRLSEKTGQSARTVKSITKKFRTGIKESASKTASIKDHIQSINTMVNMINGEIDSIHYGISPLSAMIDSVTEHIQEVSICVSKVSDSLESILGES